MKATHFSHSWLWKWGYKPRNTGGPQKLEKVRKQILSYSLQKEL